MQFLPMIFSFLQSSFVERIFNSATNKSISVLIVALTLGYAGVSDDVIKLAISYNWTFVEVFLNKYKYYLIAISVFLLMVAGYLFFTKTYKQQKNDKLRYEIEKIKLENEILQLKIEYLNLKREHDEVEKR